MAGDWASVKWREMDEELGGSRSQQSPWGLGDK